MSKSKRAREQEWKQRQTELADPESDSWLLVYNPWYGGALRGKCLLGKHQLEDIATWLWLCLCLKRSSGKVSNIFYMSNRHFVIAKIEYPPKEVIQSKLGGHLWSNFLKSPLDEHVKQFTKLYEYNYVEFGNPSDRQWRIYNAETQHVLSKGFPVLENAPFIPVWCARPSDSEAASWCHSLIPPPGDAAQTLGPHCRDSLSNTMEGAPTDSSSSDDHHTEKCHLLDTRNSVTPRPPRVSQELRLMSAPPLYDTLGHVIDHRGAIPERSFQSYESPLNTESLRTLHDKASPSTNNCDVNSIQLSRDSSSEGHSGQQPCPPIMTGADKKTNVKTEENHTEESKHMITPLKNPEEDGEERIGGELIRIINPYGVKWSQSIGFPPDLSGMWDWAQLVLGDVMAVYADISKRELFVKLEPDTTLPGIVGKHLWWNILMECPTEWRDEVSTVLQANSRNITFKLIAMSLPDSDPKEDYTSFVQPYPPPLPASHGYEESIRTASLQMQGKRQAREAPRLENGSSLKKVKTENEMIY